MDLVGPAQHAVLIRNADFLLFEHELGEEYLGYPAVLIRNADFLLFEQCSRLTRYLILVNVLIRNADFLLFELVGLSAGEISVIVSFNPQRGFFTVRTPSCPHRFVEGTLMF